MKKSLIISALVVGQSAMAAATEYICPNGLGRSAPLTFSISGDEITVNLGGISTLTGTKITSTDANSLTFGNFRPSNKGIGPGDTFNVSSEVIQRGDGEVQEHEANVGPFYRENCHTLAANDEAATCESQIEKYRLAATSGGLQTKRLSAKLYEYRLSDRRAGEDLVWDVPVATVGSLCRVDINKSRAVSCTAVIADAVSARAHKDGSSSGEAFVSKNADGSFTSGIHDTESGEFVYSVQVTRSGSSCAISSIKEKNVNHN